MLSHTPDESALDRQRQCATRRQTRPTPTLRAAERLHFHDDVQRQLLVAEQQGETIALTGATGTGKLHTALRYLRRSGVTDLLVVEPHLEPTWFETARVAAAGGRGVVLRRVHASPAPTTAQLQALIGYRGPVAVTADLDAAPDAVLAVVRQAATTVRLPALSQSREQLPTLINNLLADLPEPQSRTRFSPAVWDLFLQWHWPGNLAELCNTVTMLARRSSGGTVVLGDLPDEIRIRHRATGLLESVERETVIEALRTAGGNRSRAARELGIGRNTLYRKMREFKIR